MGAGTPSVDQGKLLISHWLDRIVRLVVIAFQQCARAYKGKLSQARFVTLGQNGRIGCS
jgi:hypothetical protein